MALCDAIRHLERREVPGAILECGVWRGGSMLAAALCLLELGSTDRELCLYDTFAEIPLPGERDRHVTGVSAAEWMEAPLAADPTLGQIGADRVRELLESTGYPPERIRLEPGLVEETIPERAPATIALCRLDTDWYDSTLHELHHLYPRISPGGVLIVDDYGEFTGSREATDEYLATLPSPPLLVRVDEAARLAVVEGSGP
jgi:O-methyltransferase